MGFKPRPSGRGVRQQQLHLNAFRTASLRKKLCEGRGWEGALVGLVRQILEDSPVTGEPGWRRYRFLETNTTFEFQSFAEWISDPNGLATSPEHLINLLEISPDSEGRALADRVRQGLKLPAGTRADLGNNVPEVQVIAAAGLGPGAAGLGGLVVAIAVVVVVSARPTTAAVIRPAMRPAIRRYRCGRIAGKWRGKLRGGGEVQHLGNGAENWRVVSSARLRSSPPIPFAWPHSSGLDRTGVPAASAPTHAPVCQQKAWPWA